jgi:hypothetical protein
VINELLENSIEFELSEDINYPCIFLDPSILSPNRLPDLMEIRKVLRKHNLINGLTYHEHGTWMLSIFTDFKKEENELE